jgi:hypothetical protein
MKQGGFPPPPSRLEIHILKWKGQITKLEEAGTNQVIIQHSLQVVTILKCCLSDLCKCHNTPTQHNNKGEKRMVPGGRMYA